MLQLLQTTGLSARQKDYADRCFTATQGLLRLLNDILDLSKIEARKLTIEQAPFETDAMLRDLSSLLSANLGTRPVELLFVIDAGLPKVLHGDVFRLRQVLLNLAGNAIKFTPRGEVIVEMNVLWRLPSSCEIAFSVSDTGIGIAAEQLSVIFEGFNQGGAVAARRSDGSGLGLTISQGIVSLMGGRLEVESELDRGSRFHFTLTFACEEDRALGQSLPPPATDRVLIVDDSEPARAALLNVTRSFGWTSDGAASGWEALDAIHRSGAPYDLIFIDWMMPELDGWQTARRLREVVSADAAIVLMGSAQGLAEVAAQTQADPNVVDAVLLKPLTASAIIEVVMDLQARRMHGSRAADPPLGPGRLGGLTILVVDDLPINVQIARELLTIEGARVEVATSGQEAIDSVRRSPIPFDVVLMDVQMPDMDGYETTRRLRDLPHMAGAAIIAMTANAMESDRAACFAANMDDYLPKPIDVEVVVRTIRKHTSQTRIDFAAALARMGNNKPLFAKIADRFLRTSGTLVEDVRAAVQIGAGTKAAQLLHQLKGSAGTVGNVPLAEMASWLETEVNRTSHLPDLSRDLARLESLLVTGNAELEHLLAGFEAAPVTPVAPDCAPTLDRTANREQATHLNALLKERNLRALDLYAELAPALEATLPAEGHAVLAAAIRDLDFAAAATVLETAVVER